MGGEARVRGGTADVGLGILAAARALKLDFVPLLEERYDLVIPREHVDSDLIRALLDLLRNTAFQEQVRALGGYDPREMGKVLAEL